MLLLLSTSSLFLPIVVVLAARYAHDYYSGFSIRFGCHSRHGRHHHPLTEQLLTHPAANDVHAPSPHRRRIMEVGWHHLYHRCIITSPLSPSKTTTTTLLRTKSLRDIMDDTTNNNNNHLISAEASSNTSRHQQQQQQQEQRVDQQKQQRLTKQLSNLSTQEIMRELEHVHGFGVSTLALLRGKTSLVEALADARLRRDEEEEEEEELLKNTKVVHGSKRTDGIIGNKNDVIVVPGVGNVIARPLTALNGDNVVTVVPGMGNFVGIGRSAVSNVIGVAAATNNLDSNKMSNTNIADEVISSNRRRIVENKTGNGAEVFAAESLLSSSDSKSSNWFSSNDVISERGYMYNDVDEELQQLRQWQQQQQQQPERNENDAIGATSSSNNSNTKLRELQIAFEFERVQSTMTSPKDVRSELESKFGIGTKYFLGIKEMEYALAVARVDYAIERRLRLGLSVDGEECINFYDDNNENDSEVEGDTIRRNSQMMESCQDLPTPEDLIAMEYDNLLRQTLWEEDALSKELESQYGIPAKHFMGKKEMAYALAVERVDRAMKEGGGYIVDDDDDDNDYDVLKKEEEVEEVEDISEKISNEYLNDDTGYYAVMTDEDMMKMMEEEMRKEREEEKVMDEPIQRTRREDMRGNPSRSTNTIGGAGSAQGPSSLSSSSSFGKVFKKEQPNPFTQTKASPGTSSFHLQTTPLAEMIKTNDKRERRSPPKRMPLSSEPPLGRQRLKQNQQQQYQNRQHPLQMGTVIGEPKISSKRDSKSLADILKGSEERLRIRSQAVMPKPKPNVQERPLSPPYDDSFLPMGGGRPSANNPRSNYGEPGFGNYGANIYSGERSESNARATQRPFEPAPFTEPGTHNAQGRSSSSSRQTSGFGGGPQRIPPQTSFSSPVTDGARRSSGSSSSSQGPFTPFTEPGKRSTNNKPPPRKRPSDPRRFNIKDTPETTQPFVTGSYVDYNTPYSPPLQVEPPPRDPRYQHAAETGTNRGNNDSKYEPYRKNKEKAKGYKSSSSPFDKWKDMLSGTKWGEEKKRGVENEEPKGFKSGNVEVFPSDSSGNGMWTPLNNIVGSPKDEIRQQAVVVEIIDAKQRIKSSRDWQDEDDPQDSPKSQPSANFQSNAWKGGPEADASTFKDKGAPKGKPSFPRTNITSNDVMQKAEHLLATNADLRAIVTNAHTNPKLREAVNKCTGNPTAFGLYLNDSDIGPILNEMKLCISRH